MPIAPSWCFARTGMSRAFVAGTGVSASGRTVCTVPELPEVETVRRGLAAILLGKRIEAVTRLWPPTFEVHQARIDELIVGARLDDVRRRGKVLLLDLDNGQHLVVHPKMTGQVVVVRGGTTVLAGGHPSPSMLAPMPNPTTRVVLTLSEDMTLFFNDQRKFGWIRLVDTRALVSEEFLSRLGPEPFGAAFTARWLGHQLARHRGASVKAVVLNQSTVAGVGNIYADESLHRAGIDPRRRAGTLTAPETARLHRAVRAVLRAAVEHGGTSFVDYGNDFRGRTTYLAGGRVFHRQGRACQSCDTPIQRIEVAGRGTNFCPHCQR